MHRRPRLRLQRGHAFRVAPLAGAVPAYATAPVLILVGAMMFRSVAAIDFARLEESLPAFLTIVLIPLTFSITQGIPGASSRT